MKTNFNPLTHGYKFANRFEFKGFKKYSNLIKNKLIYGMCGGMVFTALDSYFDQRNLPKYANPSEIPLNYTKYLWKRQKESVSLSIFLKIMAFAILPEKVVIQKSIQKELPKIIDRLSDTLPVPLIIVRSNFFQNPTHNHQVLVTQLEEFDGEINLVLYDPNHPALLPSIHINKKNMQIIQSTGEHVRGFFVNKYVYKSSRED